MWSFVTDSAQMYVDMPIKMSLSKLDTGSSITTITLPFRGVESRDRLKEVDQRDGGALAHTQTDRRLLIARNLIPPVDYLEFQLVAAEKPSSFPG